MIRSGNGRRAHLPIANQQNNEHQSQTKAGSGQDPGQQFKAMS